jgi:hypothetical protein
LREALEMKKRPDELMQAGRVKISRSESTVATLFIPKSDGIKHEIGAGK